MGQPLWVPSSNWNWIYKAIHFNILQYTSMIKSMFHRQHIKRWRVLLKSTAESSLCNQGFTNSVHGLPFKTDPQFPPSLGQCRSQRSRVWWEDLALCSSVQREKSIVHATQIKCFLKIINVLLNSLHVHDVHDVLEAKSEVERQTEVGCHICMERQIEADGLSHLCV